MSKNHDLDGLRHSAKQPSAANYDVVIALILLQALVSFLCTFAVAFERGRVAGCESRCAYDVDWAANVALWVVLTVITGLTLTGLIVWRRRGWRNWPIALLGMALAVVSAFIAAQVVAWAYQP